MTPQTDHVEISMLISRFFRALDERKFEGDWARSYFTDDVRTVTPIGSSDGIEAMDDTEEALGRYARTQHIASDVLVDTEAASGSAKASWNALMTHVHHDTTLQQRGKDANPLFTVGGYYEAELRRTGGGWRISHMSVRAVWTTGEPPVLPPEIQPRPTA
ncbi:nuclear transport factor 2 family protein [Streptomyces bacillaris]|uniref:nuclear transport factor 2 family protein n=1 Tax=unclassified Streptomyces TaxID=2593676 RepID=UPI000367EB14|nr:MULTISPECIES: nuclear transport factor 2 family protein [unclassified Streptomyces]MYT37739.1 nuclear transport factor 2 family protein [Streptomyces sp. SID8356]